MRRFGAPIVALVIAAVPVTAQERGTPVPPDSAGWKQLFDGRSLDGWRGYGMQSMPGGWAVEDGMLTRVGPGGDIVTVDEFTDFELILEWRVEEGGNSGIFYRAAEGEERIKAATFFTTMTDFSDPGEVGVFLDDSFVDGIEREVGQTGVLDSFFMSRTFSYLRSNDLIYGPAAKRYMLGEAPPAFDLLHWNGDSTNLPARMAVEYLRGLCQRDEFAGRRAQGKLSQSRGPV